MKRREFIGFLGGAAAPWPLAARAQNPERIRRIGVLGGYALHDPEVAPRVDALRKGLEELGWSEGRTIRLDYRWAAGDANRMRAYATELVNQELRPDPNEYYANFEGTTAGDPNNSQTLSLNQWTQQCSHANNAAHAVRDINELITLIHC